MTPDQLATYEACPGRTEPPTQPLTEAWLICGRRAGKSFILALIAVYLACFRSYAEFLGPGEKATVMIIATDRRQARVIFRYIRGMISGTPLLADLIERETADSLDLTNGVVVEVGTASHRSTRGYTTAAILCDEIAFWPTDDSAEPDYAILDGPAPRHVDDPLSDAAVRLQPLCQTWSPLGRLPPQLR
jgi:phage terminase large subunit-like protein